MKVLNFFYLVLAICSLHSCKKNKLEDSKESLIGNWNWIYSQHTYGWCQYDAFYETETPATLGKKCSVEFLQKGKMHFFENDKLVEKYRIVFNYFEKASDGTYYFYFYLDNDLEQGVAGSVNNDTLHLSRFPYLETNSNCENYLNFFVRE